MSASKIQWTDQTWNPVVGCTQISPGCAHCYAKEQWDRRHKAAVAGKQIAVQYRQPFEVVRTMPERLREPLTWRHPQRVFVNSVSDLFHEDVPDAFIDKVFAVMAIAPTHTFQILTKRAERMRAYLADQRRSLAVWNAAWNIAEWTPPKLENSRVAVEAVARYRAPGIDERWPLPNVWLGVSVENQRFANERIPLLLQTPAAVRFISAEPLLERVDLHRLEHPHDGCHASALQGHHDDNRYEFDASLDWVIVGGESGPGARPFDLSWARSIVAQCQSAGVPVFVKQLGNDPFDGSQQSCDATECMVHSFSRLALKADKGGDPAEWPADLRVREWPGPRA